MPRGSETLEYVRRIYANNRDWYTVSETKAQVLLAANGAFISISLGVLLGAAGDLSSIGTSGLGPETWVFLGIAVASLVGAVSSAALCMWSLHGKPSQAQLARLMGSSSSSLYPAEVLWYFGHLALLDEVKATESLRHLGIEDEIKTLSYHAVSLSQRVLRKHRYVNAGWGFTAITLISLIAASASLLVRSGTG